MNSEAQKSKAEAFRRMHLQKPILVLPNAWDGASARIFEEAGFSAIATTSAGVAHTAGYADGQIIPLDDMITIVKWIVHSVEVPVTADMESGFGHEAGEVGETVRRIIETGAVGMNLEDTIHGGERQLYELPVAVARIRAAREAANAAGIPLVINARTDVFLLSIGEKSSRFDHAVQRLNAYREAGADCLYPIGFFDTETIGRLAKAVNGPINIAGLPGAPPVSELERLGVARVSTASCPARVAMTATKKIATELASNGSFEIFGGDTMGPVEANALMAKRGG
jgi:2-methylisocitrate lyase-like PEP mutase family enzyme